MDHSDDKLARANAPAEEALRLHPFYRGKVQLGLKVPVRSFADFALWYTPGVAAPCRAIQASPEAVWEHTNRGNLIAIVSDGSRVLGLGNIGPEAGLPVMEGKALLFKYLGGVDAVPLCLGTQDADELCRAVELLAPSFGGINLEDIAQPRCFAVLDRLRARMPIPVWHDDQQGTATVVLAGLMNALEVVGKRLDSVKVALVGVGAANVATYRLLTAAGVDPRALVACDSRGVLGPHREDLSRERDRFPDKWRICSESNARAASDGIAEALRGADVCIAFSSPGPETIRPEWVKAMAKDAIVFACANPVPELWPWVAKEAGAAIVASGRSDFPNQVNNSLCFPGIFRGALDVRASAISEGMSLAAARALAALARERGLGPEAILPRMDDLEVVLRLAVATGMTARSEGLARLPLDESTLYAMARERVLAAREGVAAWCDAGIIPRAPERTP